MLLLEASASATLHSYPAPLLPTAVSSNCIGVGGALPRARLSAARAAMALGFSAASLISSDSSKSESPEHKRYATRFVKLAARLHCFNAATAFKSMLELEILVLLYQQQHSTVAERIILQLHFPPNLLPAYLPWPPLGGTPARRLRC